MQLLSSPATPHPSCTTTLHRFLWRVLRRPRIARVAVLAPLLSLACNSNPGPPPDLTVVQATDLGTISTSPDILGRDGGASALFQGVSVWIYSDTFLAHRNAEGRGLISDSWSFTSDLNAQTGISGFQERLDSAGAPAMLLAETRVEQSFNQAHNGNPCATPPCGQRWALWTSAIVADTADNQALVFYGVVLAQPGAFNFQGYGSSVALWQNFSQSPQRPTFSSPIDSSHPDLMFGQSEPNFGTAALISSGTLYVFGCGTPNDGMDKGCRLARVDPAHARDRSMWTYYAGNGTWSPQLSNAISVFEGSSIVTVSWNNYLQSYVAVYSPPFSQNVELRTAPNPEGPWSREVMAFVAVQPVSGNVYDAHEHAEYQANGGQTIYVSYSRATGEFTSEVRLEAVTLQKP
jgi:hypothetical protein